MKHNHPDILCIGSVLWDVIGRAPVRMKTGYDVPGRIRRLPGGVAMNIAMALKRFGLTPALLSAMGDDPDGSALRDAAKDMGMITDFIHIGVLPTDQYMAIEGENGLIAAIADAHGLEAAGDAILDALRDGRLATPDAPWTGPVALDGNLTEALLGEISVSPLFRQADLRVAPASPGKARRLLPLFRHPKATIYVNLIEANLLTGQSFETTDRAAEAMLAMGAARVSVTDGANPACIADQAALIQGAPPPVTVKRVTGAGDTFMAGHITAEQKGQIGEQALQNALRAAAEYISHEPGTAVDLNHPPSFFSETNP